MKNFINENKKSLIKIVISLLLLVPSYIINRLEGEFFVYAVLSILAYIIVAYEIMIDGFVAIVKKHTIDEKFLMTVASLGAIAIKEYFEACAIMLLYIVGELFEDTAIDNSKESIKALGNIRSDTARTKNGEIRDASTVKVGEIIEVLPGERIPLDGDIVGTAGEVNTSAITGESIPVTVKDGDEVLAGYLNISSDIYIKVKRPLEKSAAQRIIELSEKAFEKKTKSEKFIKRFAKIYTPIVIVLSILLAVIPPIFDNYDFAKWIYRAVSMLAISCPCAIVISVPLSYFCGLGYASKKGILIKSSQTAETLSKVKTIAFDKTGTLTKSELQVIKMETAQGVGKIDLLSLACTVDQKSTHPVAGAIIREGQKFNIVPLQGKNFKEKIGYGVECDTERGHIMAGSAEFVKCAVEHKHANVYVSLDSKYIGCITIGDELKTNSKIAFDKLRKLGIKKSIIISGDKKANVEKVARTLLADKAYFELHPEDKLNIVEEIIKENTKGTFAYCGDGINDTPSLARADVGMTFGMLSSDSAVESSDVVVIDDDIEKVPLAIRIARKIRSNVIENIVLSLGIKAIMLALCVVGIIPMWVAVASDVGLLIVAILNALRSGR